MTDEERIAYNLKLKNWRLANLDRFREIQKKSRNRPEVLAAREAAKAEKKRLREEAKAAAPPKVITEEEKQRRKERAKAYNKANPEKAREIVRRRQARKLQATPTWITKSDIKTMQLFYKEAERLTRETGIEHQVDHIYPLKGKTVCGLHVPCNLSVVTKNINNRKLNKHPEAFYGASLNSVIDATKDILNDSRTL